MAVLETSRLLLRPFRDTDLDQLAGLMANPDFMRFSLGVYDREKTQTFLNKLLSWDQAGVPSQFAVTQPADGRIIGYCGFYHHPVEVTEDVEIGYRLHPDYWSKGIATEAARAVRDHGFQFWRLPRLISLVHRDNVASRRVAEKNGMTFEKEIIFKGFPTQVFAIDRTRWLTRNGV